MKEKEYFSKSSEPIYALLEHLYFEEGLEELKFMKDMKVKHMKEWAKNTGEKICRVIFALILEKQPKYLLEILKEERK